jgi:hypothetical protein
MPRTTSIPGLVCLLLVAACSDTESVESAPDASAESDTSSLGDATTDDGPAEDTAAPLDGSATIDVVAEPREALAWLTDGPLPGATPHFLMIGLDGVRADAFEMAETPAFDLLAQNGTWTLTGSTQLSTATDSSAGWTALITGVDHTFSGVTDNESLGSRDWNYASFAKMLTDRTQVDVVIAAHWFPFAYGIFEPQFADVSSIGDDDEVTDSLAESIRSGEGDVFVLHLDDVDHAGHATGFSTDNPDYMAAVVAQDARTQRLIDAISERPGIDAEDWLVVVVTDHGGDAEGHGNMNAECQTIPFIFAGGGRQRGPWDVTVSHLDLVPTILEHFGVLDTAPEGLQGVPR